VSSHIVHPCYMVPICSLLQAANPSATTKFCGVIRELLKFQSVLVSVITSLTCQISEGAVKGTEAWFSTVMYEVPVGCRDVAVINGFCCLRDALDLVIRPVQSMTVAPCYLTVMVCRCDVDSLHCLMWFVDLLPTWHDLLDVLIDGSDGW